MKALSIVAAAGLALVGLAGCGQEPEQVSTLPTNGVVSTGSAVSATPPAEVSPTPAKPKPAQPPTDVAPPTGAQPPAGPPSTPVSLAPEGPVVPAGVERVPADQVDASALPEYYEHRGEVWVFDDGYSLQTFATATSGCGGAEAVLVDQTASAVRLMLRPLPQPQGGSPDDQMCTTVLTPRPVSVRLDAPLGERTVQLAAGR